MNLREGTSKAQENASMDISYYDPNENDNHPSSSMLSVNNLGSV